MVNPFLTTEQYDTETAIMLERAYVHDIGDAVAFTDGTSVFINTPANLFRILPAYDDNMLKLLLWHERMHMEFKHHARYFKYMKELELIGEIDDFTVTKEEVNIIMDIVVHDWLCDKFPELIATAVNNLAQLRDRNSLKFTFKTTSFEEMLEEYRRHKKATKEQQGEGGQGTPSDEDTEDEKSDKSSKSKQSEGEPSDDKDTKAKEEQPKESTSKKKGHAEGGHSSSHTPSEQAEENEVKINDSEQPPEPDAGHHDETDWSQLDKIDNKEFITKEEGQHYVNKINELKNTKIKLAQLTKTLNGLVTTTKIRTYKTPSYSQTGQHTIMKGRQNGKSALHLCFDASGSMGRDMDTFKEVISKAIPQAMRTPTTWFSGYAYGAENKARVKKCVDPDGRNYDYYKGKFDDFMCVEADSGYGDDGDRTIELCHKAEELGYAPIGVTDGGGQISWSKPMLKELKRTVLVGHRKDWLEACQKINPRIQIIYIDI